MPVKYVLSLSGVVSGLGKGITSLPSEDFKSTWIQSYHAEIRPLHQHRSRNHEPIQHGEVFVTDDGAETDLDLGHYERFIDESLTKIPMSQPEKYTGPFFQKERRGDYGGGTVQVIPHITKRDQEPFLPQFHFR